MSEVAAVPIPNASAEQLRGNGVDAEAAEPSTIVTTITSVEKTIFCAMWTRKFEELKAASSRSLARVT